MIRGLSRSLFALAGVALLTGCGSVGGFFSHRDPNADMLNLGANPRPVSRPAANPGEKPTVLPVTSLDINCPTVDVADGRAALRVGGPENASVRYQFNIGDTARECDPAGPGQATLKIAVARESDKQEVFSKTYRVEATTDGVRAGTFRMVTDPIPLPLTTLQLADVYSISVGFEGGGAAAPPKRHRRKTAS